MTHIMELCDVFAECALAGNPPAIVVDSDDLVASRVRTLARAGDPVDTALVLREAGRAVRVLSGRLEP